VDDVAVFERRGGHDLSDGVARTEFLGHVTSNGFELRNLYGRLETKIDASVVGCVDFRELARLGL
jgi:hypothetical protein